MEWFSVRANYLQQCPMWGQDASDIGKEIWASCSQAGTHDVWSSLYRLVEDSIVSQTRLCQQLQWTEPHWAFLKWIRSEFIIKEIITHNSHSHWYWPSLATILASASLNFYIREENMRILFSSLAILVLPCVLEIQDTFLVVKGLVGLAR